MQRFLVYIKNNHRDVLFLLLLIINSYVILFRTQYVPTLDGGSHAYNARIMGSLLFGSDELYTKFYQMNLEPVPNWFTSALSMILNSFLSPSVAEKIILLIFFISFPLLFRSVADRLSEKKSYLIFLVFPFTHYSLLYYGFFNFSYGILFFLLAVLFWIKNGERLTAKKLLFFALICLLTYFSHLFAFMSLLVFFAVYELYFFFYTIYLAENRTKFRAQLKDSFFRGIKLIACNIIPLVFTWLYFKNRPSMPKTYLDVSRLNKMMTEGEIFKSFGTEDYLAAFLFYLFAAIVTYAFISKLKMAIETKRFTAFFSRNDAFFFGAILMLLFFYTQADNDGYGGFICQRFSLFTFILAALWLAGRKLDKTAEIMATLTLVIGLYYFVGLKKDAIRWLNAELKKMDEVADHIREGATVAPVHFADYNWLGAHYSNYLGARKRIIITENFEASTGYFPVQWKSYAFALHLTNFPSITDSVCTKFIDQLNNYPGGPVDYILIYGDPRGQSYYVHLLAEINKKYNKVYTFENVFLYELDREKAKLTPQQLKERLLKEIEISIHANKEWMKQIEQKAKEQNLSIDTMIKRDAKFIFDQENGKQ